MPRGYPGSTPGVNPRSQGVIPRRFKRKKNFCDGNRTPDRWTDGRVGRNSDVDIKISNEYADFHAKISLISNTAAP